MLHQNLIIQIASFGKHMFPTWFKMWSLVDHLDVRKFDYYMKIHPKKTLALSLQLIVVSIS